MSKEISSLNPGRLVSSAGVDIDLLPLGGRISLRARGDLTPLEGALGLPLPPRIGARNQKAGIEALCLGPDEWVLLVNGGADDVMAALAGLAHPHSATDISAREVVLQIEGAGAATLLSIGCPRDIASIPEGQGRRTVFDGVSVTLWRDGPDCFRMDIWNSFAPFVIQTLETGCRELAAGAES